eukprot:CAMPEP_0181512196 /NCGR_PEP_ID=MMETSP1110-20121109/61841_1 /TAXON_ID=174948 /ORGANISM="Symbiodinium sp., Strain CCMP421" /LENGTH=47 /DNA_ID= /DNA_START= /DNA_END= /DNA_ORIENTATION=
MGPHWTVRKKSQPRGLPRAQDRMSACPSHVAVAFCGSRPLAIAAPVD